MSHPYDEFKHTSTYEVLKMDKPDLCRLYYRACMYYREHPEAPKSLLHKLVGDELERRRNNFR